MAEEFLFWLDGRSRLPNGGDCIPTGNTGGQPRRLRVLLIGDAEDVRGMIHRFHVEDIAAVGDWSRLLPVPDSTEVMSILILRCGGQSR